MEQENMSEKLCINCKHKYGIDFCARKATDTINLITGLYKKSGLLNIQYERVYSLGIFTCGKKGKYFEPKN